MKAARFLYVIRASSFEVVTRSRAFDYYGKVVKMREKR